MDAKQVSNKIKKNRGERLFPDPPYALGKIGKEEWKRLVGNFYITSKDIGSLTVASQSYEMYMDLYDAVTTEYYIDKGGARRKRKISIAQYCEGRSSQQQVELLSMNKALDNYTKVIKRLHDTCEVVPPEEEDEGNAMEYQDLVAQLL